MNIVITLMIQSYSLRKELRITIEPVPGRLSKINLYLKKL